MHAENNYKQFPALAAYIDRVGAEEISFKTFMVKIYKNHYYDERCMIRIDTDERTISCTHEEYAPSDAEEIAILNELANRVFPTAIGADDVAGLIKAIQMKGGKVDKRDLFELWNRRSGKIIMVQRRFINKEGKKEYHPWTLFNDGIWRQLEPGGALPFWKPRKKLSAHIMVHEGAKAAQFCEWLVRSKELEAHEARKAHPWAAELEKYEHWGIIGGALAPHRADYRELSDERPAEVVYAADNDDPGRRVLNTFSKKFEGQLKWIKFDSRWPMAWDLADPMPEKFFVQHADDPEVMHYRGPTMNSLLRPATYATELVPNPAGVGRPVVVLRSAFAEEWYHSVQPELFVHRDHPAQLYTAAEFNSEIAPFSQTDDLARLVRKDAANKMRTVYYAPNVPSGLSGSVDRGQFINTYYPGPIRPLKGDPQPWLDYMTHLVPEENDRHEVLRWCATLIARSAVKMAYGLLLVSENQGVGKEQPLTAKILTPEGFRLMKDIKKGDIICSARGGIQSVTGVYPQGVKPVYRFTFSDGSKVECGLEHNWLVSKAGSKKWEVKTTAQLLQIRGRRYIPRCEAAQFYGNKQLSIPPYVLGACIGDGHLARSTVISIPNSKLEILARCRELLRGKYEIRLPLSGRKRSCPQYVISAVGGTETMPSLIRAIGLNVKSKDRFLPEQYKFASFDDRLELLRGLMDTDGSAVAGRTSFSTASARLAQDVSDLVRSLGGSAVVANYGRKKGRPLNHSDQWRVRIRMNHCPFHLEQKRLGWKPLAGNYGLRIDKIEYVGEEAQQCIAVSSAEKLYVTDNFKVTHNTTLGERILAPLVGLENTSFPTESDIVDSQFNAWISHKRLSVINEIYAGNSSKAYNRLKSIITDKYVTVNKKHQSTYELENWTHIFACSNSMRALRISMEDRRWLVPKVTEEAQGHAYWVKFNNWLENGGLEIIKWWSEEWLKTNKQVFPGETAPNTQAKRDLIEDSFSAGQSIAKMLLEAMWKASRSKAEEYFTTDALIVREIKERLYDGRNAPTLEKVGTIRRIATDMGLAIGNDRSREFSGDGAKGRLIATSGSLAGRFQERMKAEGLKPFDFSGIGKSL